MTQPDGTRISAIVSRENTVLKLVRRLARDNTAYRKFGQIWLEGDHLCRAASDRGVVPAIAVFTESLWIAQQAQWRNRLPNVVVVPDFLFDAVSGLESAGRMGFVIDLPATTAILPGVASVVLDRLQDAGNVGSILRSAAALGFSQVIALKGSASLWSPKVLRAGMGAHFALHLVEVTDASALSGLDVPLIATSSHQGVPVHTTDLPWPCAWAFGHEGQGLDAALAQQAKVWCRIGQPGGQESLNVAAAAAICLHTSVIQRPV